MSMFTNIFSAILGGISSASERRSSERATREATEEAGKQDRKTIDFEKDLDYYYNQKRRHETAGALGVYDQFSTINNFKPNFVPGRGLDALPAKPTPGS